MVAPATRESGRKRSFRYYGWFFYSAGESTVRVPPGKVVVEVAKGYEYRPVWHELELAAGGELRLRLELVRTAPMSPHGYFSGDTHLHFDRRTADDDDRILDLMDAEDVRFGSVLCMNEPSGYSGIMDRQIWPQDFGLGTASIRSRGAYQIASGQEYRANTYGHICLLLADRLALEGLTVDPNRWPVFGDVAAGARARGGYAIHAHGGYSKEIYADVPRQLTDGVELLQFAEYRGIGLEGWYHLLSAGYRFACVGASDFPYCRALADCRTYVLLDGQPTYSAWVRGAVAGKSFVTTGPLIRFDVDGHPPGETIRLRSGEPRTARVQLRLRCEATRVTDLVLLAGGEAVRHWQVPPTHQTGQWFETSFDVKLDRSMWLAARAYSKTAAGHPDAEAHTNPVYVYVGNRAPYDARHVDWLLARLDERMAANAARKSFPDQPRVLDFFRASRDVLVRLKSAGGLTARQAKGLDDLERTLPKPSAPPTESPVFESSPTESSR